MYLARSPLVTAATASAALALPSADGAAWLELENLVF